MDRPLSSGGHLQAKTLPGVLAERARREPGRVAFRSKHLGLYRERTWAEACDLVASCALGLGSLGLKTGERLALMGDPREEWMICDLAARCLGALPCGIHPTASDAELEACLRETAASVFVAESREYVDRLLPLLPGLPALRTLVVAEPGGPAAGREQPVPYARVFAAGRDQRGGASGIEVVERLAAALDPEAPAVIVYTAGTTGAPKGVLLSHEKELAAARRLLEHYPLLGRQGHRTVSYLPLSHALGRQSAITLPLVSGVVPHFGESLEDLPQTLFEVAPTVLFTVPRYLHRLASRIRAGIAGTAGLKRAVTEAALRYGRRHVERRRHSGASGPEAALYRALHWVALRPMLNKIGFDQLELVLCGAGPVAADAAEFWQVLGLDVAEIYGQAEAGGAVVSGQRGPFPKPGSPGRLLGGREAVQSSSGELLLKCEELFEGYLGHRETAAGAGEGGWFATGDLAEVREGAVRVLGRVADVIVTSEGARVSPEPIENALRDSPYIAEAVVFGQGRPHLAALVEIDAEAVGHWARRKGLAGAGSAGLTSRPEVLQLLAEEIERVNERLSESERVRRFRPLPRALEPEAGLVTAVHGLKRKEILQAFPELLEAVYAGETNEVRDRPNSRGS